MSRNLILCSDGTGNSGGTTPDSNVYKLYNAIDIHGHEPLDINGDPKPQDKIRKEQKTFYDKGVGTSSNRYIRALTGALGIGFGKNVRDMYQFLAKNYRDGDDIYLFGFSRGAATVRAFSGFVAHCGLIDGRDMRDNVLQEKVEELYKRYSRGKIKDPEERVVPPVKFIGVWDTVSALGTPEQVKVPGTIMFLLNALFLLLGNIANLFKPHLFYDYELTGNVQNAFQALAIDDERTSFWPKVWDENLIDPEKCHVEQVWFAGMHSNVGGGYPRPGMANVAYSWMLERLETYGDVHFETDVIAEARADADPNGHMYDSRSGGAVLFRYHPREIGPLCKNRLRDDIKVHDSVVRRMEARTQNYAPGHLPGKFSLVSTLSPSATTWSPGTKQDWQAVQKDVAAVTIKRKWLYALFLDFLVFVAAFAGWLWTCNPVDKVTSKFTPLGEGDLYVFNLFGTKFLDYCSCNLFDRSLAPAEPDTLTMWDVDWWLKQIADILDYFTPQFFDAFIQVVVVQRPLLLLIGVAILFIFAFSRSSLRAKTVRKCEDARDITLDARPS